MKKIRGSTVTLKASRFPDGSGAEVAPTSVSFRLDYPGNSRVRETVAIAASEDDGVWSATWDSSVAFPGTVFYSVLATDGSADAVSDNEFQLTANPANPDQ